MEEKIAEILTEKLDYCYCDNCKYNNWEEYGDHYCDGCYRKYQNWALAESTAKDLANLIHNEYKELICFLLDGLEEEHLGVSSSYKEEIKEKWNLDF